MKSVIVDYGYRFNQFSFSKWDENSMKYVNYNGYPLIYPQSSDYEKYELITNFNLISDIPIYDGQLEMITNGISDLFNNNLNIDFELKIQVVYNGYGNIYLVWLVDSLCDIEKCFELTDNIINNNDFEKSDILFQVVYDFYNMNTLEVRSEDELEIYINSLRRLGYSDSIEDISETWNMDISIIEKVINRIDFNKGE